MRDKMAVSAYIFEKSRKKDQFLRFQMKISVVKTFFHKYPIRKD